MGILHVLCCILSTIAILAASTCFLTCGAEKALCIQYVSSINNTNTRTKYAKYRDKTRNSTPGGEINKIQWQKILDRVTRFWPSFARRPFQGAGGALRRPSRKRRPSPENPARISCRVSIVYVFGTSSQDPLYIFMKYLRHYLR